MTPDYARFLAGKAPVAQARGIEPRPFHGPLFDFQQVAVATSLRRGQGALFLDTGLGKTLCELEFSLQAAEASNGRALILAPLAVGWQIAEEGVRHGYPARVIREQAEATDGISVCNYDRLDKLDLDAFGAVTLDESSILKSFTGRTTRALIERCASRPFRLPATATPAPNDHMELGQHPEVVGAMASTARLARWFTSDQTEMGRYRLKRHGEVPFWDWMASWAVMAETPADLGFDAGRYVLPKLEVVQHRVHAGVQPQDGLFGYGVSATEVHGLKRQTAVARAERVAEVIGADAPTEAWVIWCDTDYEADALRAVLPDAVEVRGSHPTERKEATLRAFASGQARLLITKPSICGYGLNWQHAARMAFAGRSFSYEAWYQAVRRCWRFGQARPVQAHVMVAEGEAEIGRVITRKAGDHAAMKTAMREAQRRALSIESVVKVPYDPQHGGRMPAWLN